MPPFHSLKLSRGPRILAIGFAALLVLFEGAAQAQGEEGCTIGVAAGSATPDGRPLIWKNRDTKFKKNRIVRYEDAQLIYLALVTANYNKLAWAGTNEAGFCLLNAFSPDLRGKSKKGPGNGTLLKRALGHCRSVAEFETLLTKTNRSGRRTVSSFAAIDASGAAAMFEVGNRSFVRFDAADPKNNPSGFIVRSNFALSVKDPKTRKKSIERYRRGRTLCRAALEAHDLTPAHLLRQFCRDLADPAGKPYPVEEKGTPMSFDTNRCINRSSTAAGVVFQGIRRGENPELTTFWAILGEPIFSIAVPCWVAAGGVAPELRGEKQSPLCDAATTLRKRNYKNRILKEKKVPFLSTAKLPEIWRKTFPVEDKIFGDCERALTRWRRALPPPSQMLRLHRRLARRAFETLKELIEPQGS